jgi:hypothetical protein
MSRAIWRPTFGKKLGFLVVQGQDLLGLIYLGNPVIRLTARDVYLFPNVKTNYGNLLKGYFDMSVCVAAQPIGWHWNLGKLMAMIAYTLGDYVEESGGFPLKGITTTSIYGGSKATQYTRIYKYLGETEGHGHENVDDETYERMLAFLRAHCPNCTPGCENSLPLKPSYLQDHDKTPESEWCTVPRCGWRKKCCNRPGSWRSKNREKLIPHRKPIGDGANPRMRRIAAALKGMKSLGLTPLEAFGVDKMGYDQNKKVIIDMKTPLHHGNLRGVYYHPAAEPSRRQAVIQEWYDRWGLPRYEKTKDLTPPYQDGSANKRGTYEVKHERTQA